ncbi:TSUP family transporter [Janthinobacterium sp. 17J80-10]|uniref:sulfite exporter TauE/SafE family protein n=1 Tax=Janthinobacterium sp. 17J80-10 TaxID=2497863 RepID=UPI0010058BCC|nr:TSUP family transporter [Janthinobacterium sp. 17J80-10]QAU32882.1 sulfite exporter TauE/SafE family protein [Janthinobacterium sp. 17J80-10]
MPEQFVFLLGAAFLAGLVDAMGGGGGLIQVPSLFSALPQAAPATLFGTNKLASIWGTGAAAMNYARRVTLEWNAALPATFAAFAFAFCGAYAVTWLPGELVRKLLPFVLGALLAYTWRASQLGLHHAPVHRGKKERILAVGVGAAIGFYDGFFGPGTGSFLIFLFVRFFGFDFLRASAVSKVVNVACNLAALLWFGYSGNVLWQLGLAMAVLNVTGSLLGSRLALRHGSQLVRRVFLVMVGALILKSGYDAFFR